MAKMQRSKGARIEREIVYRHHDAGVPCEKISRSGYLGPDLRIANEFLGEVKSRQSGEGFTTLARWLGTNDVLFLRRDRQVPFVVMPWSIYARLMRAYTALDGASLVREESTRSP